VQDRATHVVSMVSQISVAMREQSLAASELAQGIEQVARKAEENNEEVNGNVAVSRELEQLAQRLRTNALRFTV